MPASGGAGGGGGGRAAGGAAGGVGNQDGGTSDSIVACPGAGQSLHFQDDLNGTRTTSTQVLADLGADLPIGNTARTIEMWLYMEGNESWKMGHSIVEYGGIGRCNAFGIDGGDTGIANPPQFDPFTFSGGGPCSGDNNVAITPAPPRTGWLHVAYAYDPAGIGGQANTNFLFTVNGVAQPITGARQTGALLTMQTMLSIGSGQDASTDTGQGFTGRIDEFRFWNTGRTAQEILDNYRIILRGDEPGLVAYYHFDEGMGTTPMDASTKHHNASFASNNARPAPTWVASTGLTLTCKP
jgi:Concanavalin A-like lectin/glucanases superfamily